MEMIGTTSERVFDEEERLAALRRYDFLDPQPEAAFDRFVALAQDLFDLPISLICMIDRERQWFKARIGLDVSEMPRAWGFCNHAIQQTEPLVVLDSHLDARFAGSPLVVGPPHIRFYAGAAIRDPAGFPIGTVCVVSDAPKACFTERDRAKLSRLADVVANELELRRIARRAIRQSDKKDILIREGHLHVANSLQMIADVLQTQMQYLREKAVIAPLRNAVNRIIAVGEVHQQLRRQNVSDTADAADYTGRLLRRLWQAIAPPEREHDLDIALPASFLLPVEMLVRLGFVATELVVNALQHGAGRVRVELRDAVGGADLIVIDAGPGLPERWQRLAPRDAVGLRLVRMLAGEAGMRIDPENRNRVVVHIRQ